MRIRVFGATNEASSSSSFYPHSLSRVFAPIAQRMCPEQALLRTSIHVPVYLVTLAVYSLLPPTDREYGEGEMRNVVRRPRSQGAKNVRGTRVQGVSNRGRWRGTSFREVEEEEKEEGNGE